MEELNYKGEKFNIRWDPKEEMILMETWGVHALEDAQEYSNMFLEFIKKIPGNESISFLLDVSEQSKLNRNTSLGTRKEYSKIAKHPRSGDSAIVGANVIIKVVVSFISMFSKRKNIKCFTNKEEALGWLRARKDKRKSFK